MGAWTLDDIPWRRFDRAKLDPELVRIVKAASLVEHNGAAYANHLCRVFADDPPFQAAALRWGEEEAQHGRALARWAALADPKFDFAVAFARFAQGFRGDFDSSRSRRGSRAGEMVARCIVETGTSSYYTALAEATNEPVLKRICQRIAADELRHYRLFLTHLDRYLVLEGLGVWGRLGIALGRIRESEDDELAFAYHAANDGETPYDRAAATRAYARRVYAVYRRHHVERGIAMVLKAAGLNPTGRLNRVATRIAWWAMQRRVARLQRVAA
jgi:rubrerythrin